MPTSAADNIAPLRRGIPCPQCRKDSVRAYYPFCSKRCADLDLGSWLNGRYTIATSADEGHVTDNE